MKTSPDTFGRMVLGAIFSLAAIACGDTPPVDENDEVGQAQQAMAGCSVCTTGPEECASYCRGQYSTYDWHTGCCDCY